MHRLSPVKPYDNKVIFYNNCNHDHRTKPWILSPRESGVDCSRSTEQQRSLLQIVRLGGRAFFTGSFEKHKDTEHLGPNEIMFAMSPKDLQTRTKLYTWYILPQIF